MPEAQQKRIGLAIAFTVFAVGTLLGLGMCGFAFSGRVQATSLSAFLLGAFLLLGGSIGLVVTLVIALVRFVSERNQR